MTTERICPPTCVVITDADNDIMIARQQQQQQSQSFIITRCNAGMNGPDGAIISATPTPRKPFSFSQRVNCSERTTLSYCLDQYSRMSPRPQQNKTAAQSTVTEIAFFCFSVEHPISIQIVCIPKPGLAYCSHRFITNGQKITV